MTDRRGRGNPAFFVDAQKEIDHAWERQRREEQRSRRQGWSWGAFSASVRWSRRQFIVGELMGWAA